MTTTYPHVYVLVDETRIPGLNARRTYTCACGAALNVPQDDTEPKERIEGDNCPTSMRAWLDCSGIGKLADASFAAGRLAERTAIVAWLTIGGDLTITTGREQDVYAATLRAAADNIAEGKHRAH